MVDISRVEGLPRTPRSRAMGGPDDRKPRGKGGEPFLPHRTQGTRSINNVPSKPSLRRKDDNFRQHPSPDPLHQRVQSEAVLDEGDHPALQGYSQAKSELHRGLDIWSRVATVASTLTISVSQAWATNIKISAGEETPPGEDSRLTRAMKAYHLDRARHPTDLPLWLFEEHERRPLLVDKTPDANQKLGRDLAEESSRAQSREFLTTQTMTPVVPGASTPQPQHTHQPGADRLRALREKKRNPAGPSTSKSDDGLLPEPAIRRRIGLPSGPATKPRQV